MKPFSLVIRCSDFAKGLTASTLNLIKNYATTVSSGTLVPHQKSALNLRQKSVALMSDGMKT